MPKTDNTNVREITLGAGEPFPSRYTMGFSANDIPLPDPAEFDGRESDLDTMGERDATGYLHRNMVATKFPVKMQYNNIPIQLAQEICDAIRYEKFKFTWPSLYHGGLYSMDAYVGDREFKLVRAPEDGVWLANLSFSVIEY